MAAAKKEDSPIKHFTGSYSDFTTLLSSQADLKLVVVDFFATWCGPCTRMAPIIAALADLHKDVLFVKVDVDECEDVASTLGITAMPTFMFFKAGKRVHMFKGANEGELTTSVMAHK